VHLGDLAERGLRHGLARHRHFLVVIVATGIFTFVNEKLG
jgi:hypothetical protein